MPRKNWPCKIKKGKITPCHGLSEVLQDAYGRGTRQQGVSMHTMIDINTHKFSRQLVVLKSGDHGKKGIIMNFCPFCAGPLRENDDAST